MKKIISFVTAISMLCMSSTMAFSVCAENDEANTAVETNVYDINGDGTVNVIDISVLSAHLKNIKHLDDASITRADINGDGKVDIADLAKVVSHVKGKELTEFDWTLASARDKIEEFINANHILASVCDEGDYRECEDHDRIVITYVAMRTYVYDQIEAFIQENNIDPDLILFIGLDVYIIEE